MGLAALAIFALIIFIPLQHNEYLLVNHYPDGHVWVEPLHQADAPSNPSQVESELIHYVVNRESFADSSYKEQYLLINLMSNHEVSQQYRDTQSPSNPQSPINLLRRDGLRTVHVESVIFIDSILKNKGKPPNEQTHTNLAEVNFTVSDQSKNSTLIKTHPFTALISWATPLLVWSAHINNYEEKYRNLGVDAILEKSCTAEDLENAVQDCCLIASYERKFYSQLNVFGERWRELDEKKDELAAINYIEKLMTFFREALKIIEEYHVWLRFYETQEEGGEM